MKCFNVPPLGVSGNGNFNVQVAIGEVNKTMFDRKGVVNAGIPGSSMKVY
jgi:hypothetical protein